KFIDRVGYHNPVSQPKELVIDVEKYQEWVKKGAQPSDTVARLFEGYTPEKAAA
ncbi:MAG: 30S ribosomal protein S16, partial [Patescibacteria group bacterium]|nr:30S ribosomal protein S16 [Patescibacteria group bacterium]